MHQGRRIEAFALRIPIEKRGRKGPIKTAFFLIVNTNKSDDNNNTICSIQTQAQELGFKRIRVLEHDSYAVWHFCGKHRKSENILRWLKQANIPVLNKNDIIPVFYPNLCANTYNKYQKTKEEKN